MSKKLTYTDFQDMGSHLSKAAWNWARELVGRGIPPNLAIKEGEILDEALKVGEECCVKNNPILKP
jgi:hypothetical protein